MAHQWCISVSQKFMQSGQTGMEPKTTSNAGNVNLQQARLRYRDVRGRPAIGITHIVIKGNDHVAAVIATEQEYADQSLVVGRLGERLEQAETLEGQSGCANCAERPT